MLGVFGKDRMNSTIESLEAIVAGECTSPKNTSVIPDVSMAAWYTTYFLLLITNSLTYLLTYVGMEM